MEESKREEASFYIYICEILLYTVCIITLRCTCELFPPRLTRPIHNRMTAAEVLPVIARRAPPRRPNIVRPPDLAFVLSLLLSWGREWGPPIVLNYEARIVHRAARSILLPPAAAHNRQIGTTKLADPVIPVRTTIGEIPL